MSNQGVVCARFSPDIQAAATQLAEAQGVSLSEWVRELAYRAVYGEAPDIAQGYMQGRSIGYRIALVAIKSAVEGAPIVMPDNVEDAVRLLQEIGRAS